jgi:hypothetical protein
MIKLSSTVIKRVGLSIFFLLCFSCINAFATSSVFWSTSLQNKPEGIGQITIQAKLSSPAGMNTSVSFVTGGTATANVDYTIPSPLTLTFAPGSISATKIIYITNDNIDEPYETIVLTLVNPVGLEIGSPSTQTITITDNDPIPSVKWSVATQTVSEAAGTATATAILSNPSSSIITVQFSYNTGSATSGTDFSIAAPYSFTFDPMVTSQTKTISIVNDPVYELNETIILNLNTPVNATIGTPNPHTITITSDDALPTLQWSASSQIQSECVGTFIVKATLSAPAPAGGVTALINLPSANATAINNVDYTLSNTSINIAQGQTYQNITVDVIPDNLTEGSETIKLKLVNPTNATIGTPQTHTATINDGFSKWDFQSYLKGSMSHPASYFGEEVTLFKNTAVVTGIEGTYVFNRTGSLWSEDAFLPYHTSPLAISNTTLYMDGEIYTKLGSTWIPQATVPWGDSVAIYDDTIVVGEASANNSTGQVHVYVQNGSVWSLQATLTAPNAEPDDYFGIAVSIAEDTIVVGAFSEDSNQTWITDSPNPVLDDDSQSDSGAAYVFQRTGTTWEFQSYLKPPNAENKDWFGNSVSISSDTIVVGAVNESSSQTWITNSPDPVIDNNNQPKSGAAYVFQKVGENWEFQSYLKAPNADAGDAFGYDVSVAEDTILVVAWDEDSKYTTIINTPDLITENDDALESGAAYVFQKIGEEWKFQSYLKAPNGEKGDHFGHLNDGRSLYGDTIILGAHFEEGSGTTIINGVNDMPGPDNDDDSGPDTGAAYVFVRGCE